MSRSAAKCGLFTLSGWPTVMDEVERRAASSSGRGDEADEAHHHRGGDDALEDMTQDVALVEPV
jgi:hypothetical protein